jgi:hypothetical protein
MQGEVAIRSMTGPFTVSRRCIYCPCAGCASIRLLRKNYFFLRQLLMKLLRASPLSAWVDASALQDFIFSC